MFVRILILVLFCLSLFGLGWTLTGNPDVGLWLATVGFVGSVLYKELE